MNTYAISTCLLKKAGEDKIICTGILNKISDSTTPYKVVADKKGKILDLYRNLIATHKSIETAIWIKHLTTAPEQIEYVDVDLVNQNSEILCFIETATKIRNKKQLIVDNHNSIPPEIKYIKDSNIITHNNEEITVLNSSEAISTFNSDIASIKIDKLNYKTTKMKQENKGNVIVGEGGSATDIQTGNRNKTSKKKIQPESLFIGLAIGIIASLIAEWIWSKIG